MCQGARGPRSLRAGAPGAHNGAWRTNAVTGGCGRRGHLAACCRCVAMGRAKASRGSVPPEVRDWAVAEIARFNQQEIAKPECEYATGGTEQAPSGAGKGAAGRCAMGIS